MCTSKKRISSDKKNIHATNINIFQNIVKELCLYVYEKLYFYTIQFSLIQNVSCLRSDATSHEYIIVRNKNKNIQLTFVGWV